MALLECTVCTSSSASAASVFTQRLNSTSSLHVLTTGIFLCERSDFSLHMLLPALSVSTDTCRGSPASSNEDWEDWVFVVSDEDLLQRTLSEKARLSVLIDCLKKEISALKANNRAIAKENNALGTDKKELNVCLKPV